MLSDGRREDRRVYNGSYAVRATQVGVRVLVPFVPPGSYSSFIKKNRPLLRAIWRRRRTFAGRVPERCCSISSSNGIGIGGGSSNSGLARRGLVGQVQKFLGRRHRFTATKQPVFIANAHTHTHARVKYAYRTDDKRARAHTHSHESHELSLGRSRINK